MDGGADIVDNCTDDAPFSSDEGAGYDTLEAGSLMTIPKVMQRMNRPKAAEMTVRDSSGSV